MLGGQKERSGKVADSIRPTPQHSLYTSNHVKVVAGLERVGSCSSYLERDTVSSKSAQQSPKTRKTIPASTKYAGSDTVCKSQSKQYAAQAFAIKPTSNNLNPSHGVILRARRLPCARVHPMHCEPNNSAPTLFLYMLSFHISESMDTTRVSIEYPSYGQCGVSRYARGDRASSGLCTGEVTANRGRKWGVGGGG